MHLLNLLRSGCRQTKGFFLSAMFPELCLGVWEVKYND